MGTGILCREADKSVPVPMCVTQVLISYDMVHNSYQGKSG